MTHPSDHPFPSHWLGKFSSYICVLVSERAVEVTNLTGWLLTARAIASFCFVTKQSCFLQLEKGKRICLFHLGTNFFSLERLKWDTLGVPFTREERRELIIKGEFIFVRDFFQSVSKFIVLCLFGKKTQNNEF